MSEVTLFYLFHAFVSHSHGVSTAWPNHPYCPILHIFSLEKFRHGRPRPTLSVVNKAVESAEVCWPHLPWLATVDDERLCYILAGHVWPGQTTEHLLATTMDATKCF